MTGKGTHDREGAAPAEPEAAGPAPREPAALPEEPLPPAREPSAAESPDRARWVAVLIMVVTLLGAVFTYAQTSASNRSAAAARRSDAAAVEAEAETVRAAGRISALWRIWVLTLEEGQAWASLSGSDTGAFLAPGFSAAAMATGSYAGFDVTGQWGTEYQRLYAETWAPAVRAGEFQKAFAAERGGWGAKGGQYVAVVTVLAVALFLLGLSRTSVAGASGPLLVWSGLAVAAVAAVWGLAVAAGSVASSSPEAIDAFVEGQIAFGSASEAGQLQVAEEAFTRAIEARPDYSDAYFQRGYARAQLDFLQEGGPHGSAGARDDFARVVQLDSLNPVAWNNLAVAHFWLGDLARALAAVERAVEIAPGDPLANLNLAFFRLLGGDEQGYEAQLAACGDLLAGAEVHEVRRAYAVVSVTTEAVLVARQRPEYAAAAARYQEDVIRLDHQVAVANEFFGGVLPEPVAATVSTVSLSPSVDGLTASFDATGVAEGTRWLYRTYRGGVLDRALSIEPQPWPFAVPDDRVTIDLAPPEGFPAAVPVRLEVFLDGYLVGAGDYLP